MFDMDLQQRIRFSLLFPVGFFAAMVVLSFLGVGEGSEDWRQTADWVLEVATHTEGHLFLWALPSLLLFLVLTLLRRTLRLHHAGWRRISILGVCSTGLIGVGLTLRGLSHPMQLFTGMIIHILPLLLMALLLVEVSRWVGAGFVERPRHPLT